MVADRHNIVASKYFHGKLGSPERETSVAQLVQRVVTHDEWGKQDGYSRPMKTARISAWNWPPDADAEACFNSPVWFNVGVKEARGYGWIYDKKGDRVAKLESGVVQPQCSACFIVSVKDSLESILDWQDRRHAVQVGIGTGSKLSRCARRRVLSGGGRAPGALVHERLRCVRGRHQIGREDAARSQMVISTRTTRHRAVHLVQGQGRKKAYTWWKPVRCVARWRAYSSIFFQNANNSVRATDDFMQAASATKIGDKSVSTGQPVAVTRRAT